MLLVASDGLALQQSGAVAAERICGADGQVAIAALREGEIPEGRDVIVEGVVSGVFAGAKELGGFFLQQGAEPPRGIFVYDPAFARSAVAEGQHLRLEGTFTRFRGRPQIVRPEWSQLCSRPGPPDPVPLSLPAPAAALDALLDVRIQLAQPMVVTGNYELGRYGSLELVPGERLSGVTSSRADARGEREILRIQLDDGSYRRDPDPIPYRDAMGTRRAGDHLPELTGILTEAFAAYRVHPTEPPRFVSHNRRPPPPSPPDAGSLRIATLNLENYFLTLGQRGAGDRDARRRQGDKLRAAILALEADILSLVEVENRPEAIQSLVDRLNESLAPARRYRALRHPDAGTDVIRQVILYRPSRLRAMGSASDTAAVHHRAPLLGWWSTVDDGKRLGVVSVHLKSKVNCPESGDIDRGQGCWNAQRVAEANRVLHWLEEQDHEEFPVLIAGDLNAYSQEDPVRILAGAGKSDLVAEAVPDRPRHTYVFRGVAGQLDYILGRSGHGFEVTGGGIWHINSDEPPFLAYDGRQPAPGPWRSSDHDPVWVDLRLH